MYLAAIADSQPQPPTMHSSQYPGGGVLQPGAHYMQKQQQQMMPQSLMAARFHVLRLISVQRRLFLICVEETSLPTEQTTDIPAACGTHPQTNDQNGVLESNTPENGYRLPRYNVNLQSIAVNGQILSIASSVFATSSNRGTIIDSGTTLAYLAEEVYDPFVNAINSANRFAIRKPYFYQGKPVLFNFLQGGAAVWCIGFQKLQGQGITILGGSLSVNVSAMNNGRTEFVNAGQLDNSSVPYEPCKLLPSIVVIAFLLHIAFFGVFLFL
ncbi:hypothetical protein PHJA_000220200 [Phtheirospermum japonicum]|uniref:Xylanase inhibitor C-terminal domain-containing protein n=1 Tax=Phtheirospermum japonicum TaxID=374723 RepID=A0A830B649_9LAMI|nr:hypothetical protein PHJA_000220200 [Phtheirospermum japonicum]